jgi:putative flippase GtrA
VTFESLKQLLEEHAVEIWQFARFVGVSAAALCVDVSIYWALLSVLPYAFAAAAGGYVFGVLTHYLLSSRVVFRHRFDKRGVVEEAPTVAKFFAAGFSGLVVTAIVVSVLADVLGFHPLVAKLFAAGCSFIVVFLSLRLFVFNQTLKPSAPKCAPAAT